MPFSRQWHSVGLQQRNYSGFAIQAQVVTSHDLFRNSKSINSFQTPCRNCLDINLVIRCCKVGRLMCFEKNRENSFPEKFVCVQPSTKLFGMPFPLPTPQLEPEDAGIGNSGTSPRPRFEGCARQPSGQEATLANLFRTAERVPGLQRGPKAELLCRAY